MMRRGGLSLIRVRICTEEVWVEEYDLPSFAGDISTWNLQEIKRVLSISCRMIVWRVEGIEAKPLGFDFCGFRNSESNLSENRDDLSSNIGKGMGSAVGIWNWRQRRIYFFSQSLKIGLFFNAL